MDVIYPDNELGGYLAARHLDGAREEADPVHRSQGERQHEREWDLRLEGVRRGLVRSGDPA